MKKTKKSLTMAMTMTILTMIVWSMMILQAASCPPDGSACKDCILARMKYGCSSCVPVLRCMARCLWAGTSSSSKCAQRCDCDPGTPTRKPTLSYCKKCMARCKCSCLA